MNVEDALAFTDNLVFTKTGKHLNTLQKAVFTGAWSGEKYDRIAQNCYCSEVHAKMTGSALWDLITQTLGEKVTKKTFRAAIERKLKSNKEAIRYDRRSGPTISEISKIADRLQELELPGGAVKIGSNFYIERPPIESFCYQRIAEPGALIRIKAPPKMGKTSLTMRILDRAGDLGYQKVYLNFQAIDREILCCLNKLLQWLCCHIGLQLQLSDRVEEYWKDSFGSTANCNQYFEKYLLEQISQPLVLALDGLDSLFDHPKVANEFFLLLRAWYEKAKNIDLWNKLRLVLVHTGDFLPINKESSPFNIGLGINLPEFRSEQVIEFANRYGLNWNEFESTRLITKVGGNPYQLHLALYNLVKRDPNVEDLLSATKIQPRAPRKVGESTLIEGVPDRLNYQPGLIIIHSSGKRFTIHEANESADRASNKVYLGRRGGRISSQPEIDLTDIPNSQRISRSHAYIFWNSDLNSYVLVDDNSTNTTSLNGQVLKPEEPYPLNDGDLLEFGKEHLIQFTVELKE